MNAHNAKDTAVDCGARGAEHCRQAWPDICEACAQRANAAPQPVNDYAAATLAYAPKHDAKHALFVINSALRRGWAISVYDGEEWTVKQSTNAATIWAALAGTEMDTLRIRDENKARLGSVLFVYGNSPGDLVADYTISRDCTDDVRWQDFTNEVDEYAQKVMA